LKKQVDSACFYLMIMSVFDLLISRFFRWLSTFIPSFKISLATTLFIGMKSYFTFMQLAIDMLF